MIVGLDVGGTKVAGGLVSAANEVLLVRQRPTSVDGARDPGLLVTLSLARELVAAAAERGLVVEGIGAGLPEYVDTTGRLRSHEVMAWTTQPAELLAELGPVTIDSDVRCAALGEGAAGVARGLASYVFVVAGTGISHALVQAGHPWAGARGEAIAFGELEVLQQADADGVGGNSISLERYASGYAIRMRHETATGRAIAGAEEVFRMAQGGDAIAALIVRSAGQALGEGLATLTHLLDPGAVVVGGGLSGAGQAWRKVVEASYRARVARRPEPPPLVWATLGDRAGIIGAAIAHRRRMSVQGADS